jgi:hypothetical protein
MTTFFHTSSLTVLAFRKISSDISNITDLAELDGRFENADWQAANFFSELHQIYPWSWG